MVRVLTHCPVCGDRDVVSLGGGMIRCRTCGVVPQSAGASGWRILRKGVIRVVILMSAVAAVDVVLGYVEVTRFGTLGLGVPGFTFFSGVALLILGGISGGAPIHGGVTTMRAEMDARFSSAKTSMSGLLMTSGLGLMGIGLLLYILFG